MIRWFEKKDVKRLSVKPDLTEKVIKMYQRKEKLKIIVVELNDEIILATHLYIEKNKDNKIGHIHDVLMDKSRYKKDLIEECLKRSIGALE